MGQPQIIQGSLDEFLAHTELKERKDLLLVIPLTREETSEKEPGKSKLAVSLQERDPEQVGRVKSVRGKYAHVGVSVADLHAERQADKEKEEVSFPGEQR